MNHRSFPNLPELPFEVPKEFFEKIYTEFPTLEIEQCRWIKLSLVLPSFIHEHKNVFLEIGVGLKHLSMLETIGNISLGMALHLAAYLDPKCTSPGKVMEAINEKKSGLFLKVAKSFHLMDYALMGKGDEITKNLNDVARERMTIKSVSRFLGALNICYGQKVLDKMLSEHALPGERISTDNIDFRSLLQEFSQDQTGDTPKYNVISEIGPEHEKEFIVEVYAMKGRSATGSARSKKAACKAAAEAFIKKYSVPLKLNPKSNLFQASSKPRFSSHRIPEKHLNSIRILGERFHVPQSKLPLISQALVRASFVHENQRKGHEDSTLLCQLGSAVLSYFAIRTTVIKLHVLKSLENIDLVALHQVLVNRLSLAACHDFLHLDKSLLIGKGESQIGLSDKAKADDVQALIAAVFLAHEGYEAFEESLPTEFIDWFDGLAEPPGRSEEIEHPTSLLQKRLQLLGMTHDYHFRVSGLEHTLNYYASLRIDSPELNRTITLRAPDAARSKKMAAKFIAARANAVFDEANLSMWTKHLYISQGSPSEPFAKFILQHEMATAPKELKTVRKWCKQRLLGTKLLLQNKIREFIRWGVEIERLTKSATKDSLELRPVLSFYQQVGSLADKELFSEEINLIKHLKSIEIFVRSLDPEKPPREIRKTDAFQDLLKLGTILRLMSGSWSPINLEDLFSGLLLLGRKKRPYVRVDRDVPSIILWEREGLCGALLQQLIAVLEENSANDISEILIGAVLTRDSMLKLEMITELKPQTSSGLLSRLQNNLLFRYLRRALPILSMEVTRNGISVETLILNNDQDSYPLRALHAYYNSSSLGQLEIGMMSRLLHDLKNELVGFEVSLGNYMSSRTSFYKSLYDASRHSESALRLCLAAGALMNAITSPPILEIAPSSFIRDYLADKMSRIPENIRLVPPRTCDSCTVFTSPDFLRSILENLINNSLESLTSGGEIAIDWLFEERGKVMIIQVEDNGPGMDQERLDSLLAGKSVVSTKSGGSGIGILTVHAMLRTLGGTMTGELLPNSGVMWTLYVPSANEFELDGN